MAFFSKALDKLKGAVRKTARVLNTDVRTLFIPGRQINEEFLNELEEKFLQADMGAKTSSSLVEQIRERWRLGRIRNAAEAEQIIREQLVVGWPPPETRERVLALRRVW